MKLRTAITFCVFLLPILAAGAFGQKKAYKAPEFTYSPELETVLRNAVNGAIRNSLPVVVKPEEVTAAVIDLSDPGNFKSANVNGEAKIYPASVVKMFYMAALHQWLEDGTVKLTPELERGLQDMIGVSSNDATHYIFDVLTGTSGGTELSPRELRRYAYKKNAVNRYFQGLGYTNINVNQKTYCEDIYGRERQFWEGGKERNKLTANATARLMAEIALRRFVSPERSLMMLELMKRDPFAPTDDVEDQAHGFTGISLLDLNLRSARLWSKAGYTSSTRHDAAYIELPGGAKFVIVIFTENHADERRIIPGIATPVIEFLNRTGP